MFLAIDVGGSKVLLSVFDAEGTEQKSAKIKTPIMYPDFIAELKQQIHELIGDEQPEVCAIALPANLDRDNGVAFYFGNLPWENVHIRDDLADTLHCPIVLENDAKLACLAEAYSLRSMYKRVLYITISTGIGIGLVVNGVIDHTVSDAGGRGVILEHNGSVMAWEEFASGRAINQKTGKLASEIEDPAEWYIVARNIAIGLINLIGAYSPDCIVIGGGVGAHLEKFHEQLHEELELYRSKLISTMPQIIKAQHPEEAVVYGGYLLCRQYKKTAALNSKI